ncbi:hypothetical protein FRC18_006019, partial [Serendipita sp. 400]
SKAARIATRLAEAPANALASATFAPEDAPIAAVTDFSCPRGAAPFPAPVTLGNSPAAPTPVLDIAGPTTGAAAAANGTVPTPAPVPAPIRAAVNMAQFRGIEPQSDLSYYWCFLFKGRKNRVENQARHDCSNHF